MLSLDRLGTAPLVPTFTTFEPRLNAYLATGADAVELVSRDLMRSAPRPVALDIEAAGLGPAAFNLKCVTASWTSEQDGRVYSVLLDPRHSDHAGAVRDLTDHAATLVLHNAAYDVPVLYNYGLMSLEAISRVWDTVVAARMAYPDRLDSKTLTALVSRPDLLALPDNAVTMAQAFTAAGYRTQRDGYAGMDVDSGLYRLGAMADTALTLQLGPAIVEAVVTHLTNNPFMDVDRQRALELLEREQQTNRVMLRTSARGLLVDTDYLRTYSTSHAGALETASSELTAAGLDPLAGNLGAKLVELLHSTGELPDKWPVTETGRPKADKAAIAKLGDHPLAIAQRKVAELSKVTGYLEKVDGYAQITGRIHPQVAVLGASATGRMAYSEPELQQFPGPARPILVPEPGTNWVSIDWSSIEPVVVANCAGDRDFLRGFNETGADLYAPIVASAGVDRKTAKVVLLAAMYGQGRALLAANLGTTEDNAQAIQSKVFESMPLTRKFLDGLRVAGDTRGGTTTADGRYLPVPVDRAGRSMGYKATNYFTQGTAYSVLSESINTLEAAGLGDAIYLAMHDELVVNVEALEDVRAVMETAPHWLNTFAGHQVTLRTDANVLPGHWDYV